MTKYGLRARVFTLTLAPTLIIGLLLSAFFTLNRYQDLEHQLILTGSSIIEPLAISSEYAMTDNNREAVRRLISYAHRKHSDIIRSIAVFNAKNQLFVTSNFHRNFDALMYPNNQPIPVLLETHFEHNVLIIRAPILSENPFSDLPTASLSHTGTPIGYIALELDLTSLRLQQYQEIFTAFIVLLMGLGLSSLFAYRLMKDVTRPISNMVSVVDRIRRGHLDIRIEGQLLGELDTLKNGINAMAISLSEYHIEMQQSIDQATSDLRETLEQLEIQNVELDIAKKRAQEAARVKSEFLANMSHELRTPLNGVIGFTRQILKTPLTSSQQDYLLTIEKSANNLLTIINDILDFSKLEAGKLSLENIPFDFATSLDDMLCLLAPSAHEKGIELTLNIDPQIPESLIGDPLRIQQVLTNLIGNAVKFTESGNIDIQVSRVKDNLNTMDVEFMVSDTGIGISKRQQSLLFQAFSQADASISRHYGGTGLGLVITQKLVSQMGGKIRLNSQLHHGSQFSFILTLIKTDLPVSQHLVTDTLLNKSLLLIEPNDTLRLLLTKQLTHVGLVVNSHATLPTESSQYDFVLYNLSPITHPPLSQLQKDIQVLDKQGQKLIISLPANELSLSEQLIQTGVSHCLSKPISLRKLFNVLIDSDTVDQRLIALTTEKAKVHYPLHILAVDDNPANLKLISVLLNEMVDQVTVASGGQDALTLCQKHEFDLILMDIQMPEMDGVTASQHIHQSQLNRHTPIIAVTAHAMEGERERLLCSGMDDYLTKPIEESILHQTLTKWGKAYALSPHKSTSNKKEEPIKIDCTLDWELALIQAAGKEDLAKDMLQMLLNFMPEVKSLINKGLNDHAVDLWPTIHKLHGSAAYCGVPRLKNLCHTIETELKKHVSIEDLEPELLELMDEMENITKAAIPYQY